MTAGSQHVEKRYLDWDSSIFGLRIGRVIAPRLDAAAARETLTWRDAERLDCVYLLIGSDDATSVRHAEDCGFRFVDIRVTFESRIDGGSATVGGDIVDVRAATVDDMSALAAIARASHGESRFYVDGRLPRAACDALHEAWIRNAFGGRAKVVLVAEHAGEPAGYLALTQPGDDDGQIDLLAVAASARRRGLAERLVSASRRWCFEQGLERMLVVTQGRNVPAQRLYQAAGFKTLSVELWYHLWR
jgi:ribosomal protein S18 acetylase RimI-like enzyme